MPTTPNKGYEVQVTGSNSGTWGDVLNDDVISPQDNNLGGIVSKSVAGSNITLSDTESQMVIVSLSGAQSADIQLTTSCIGFFFVENLTTNSFNITVVNDQIATGVVVPKGRSTVISDATNGCRIAGTDSFPPGTVMPFGQSSAPTGWTKIVANDNAAMRVVSGPASSGGSVAFTTAFASQSVNGSIGGTAITIAQMPLHGHPTYVSLDPNSTTNTTGGIKLDSHASSAFNPYTGSANPTPGCQVGGAGGGQSHSHSFTGTSINLEVKYVDVIMAQKD
jgi:hypothetical protein